MKKINSRTNKGFTLVETLVAVAILVTAVTGAYSAAQGGISLSIFAKDQIVAFYLAQEGVEQIRNIRDENGLKGLDWLTTIASNSNDPCYFGQACIVDAAKNTVTKCSDGPGSCPFIRQAPATDASYPDFMGYDPTWNPTIYKREITLTKINSNEVSVVVTINWSKGLVNRTFRVKENILNWQ